MTPEALKLIRESLCKEPCGECAPQIELIGEIDRLRAELKAVESENEALKIEIYGLMS